MCYFASIGSNIRDIVKEFDVTFPHAEQFKPLYSVSAFTFPDMPVISNKSPDKVSFYTWGLIPYWVKDREQVKKLRQRTLNARSETIFEKRAFRHSVISKKCLVIVDGFFEWRHFEKKKYPYYIYLKTRNVFTLAGIWDSWTDPETDKTVNTFAVVTTGANEIMARVHNSRKRMPVILPKEQEQDWLNRDLDEKSLRSIMQPYSSIEMDAYPVKNSLNKLGYNVTDETIKYRYEYPELPGIY